MLESTLTETAQSSASPDGAQLKRFAKINLKGFGGYVQPLDQMDTFISEIQDANVGDVWTITIIEMTEAEHDALPEFQGF